MTPEERAARVEEIRAIRTVWATPDITNPDPVTVLQLQRDFLLSELDRVTAERDAAAYAAYAANADAAAYYAAYAASANAALAQVKQLREALLCFQEDRGKGLLGYFHDCVAGDCSACTRADAALAATEPKP